jgi:acyl-CoA synthetase (AMP-forming)/AMP-acid ligase II
MVGNLDQPISCGSSIVRGQRQISAGPTLVNRLQQLAAGCGDAVGYIFLKDGDEEDGRLSYGDLDLRARAIAWTLAQHCHPGDRVL